MRAFFAEGVDKMHIPLAVEALPMLLHLSVFLFLSGLVIFLFNVEHAVFSSVMWWTGLFLMVYVLITVMPIVRHNSPYYSPLSQPAWFLYASMNYLLYEVLASKFPRCGAFESRGRFSDLRDHYHGQMLGGLEKAVGKTVAESSLDMDIRIFDWTMGVLEEDDSLEKFFEAAPGFYSSKLVNHLESNFIGDVLNRFWNALNRFMDRTLSSDSVIALVKTRRFNIYRDIVSKIPFPSTSFEREEEHLNEIPIKFSLAFSRLLDRTLSVTESVVGKSSQLVTCLDAALAALDFDGVSQILWDILNGRWPELLQFAEIGHSLRRWSSSIKELDTPMVRRIVAQIIVGARKHDEGWISLVKAEFAVPDRDIRSYISHEDISHEDSVLLFILIHVTRQAFNTASWTPFVLSSLSEFNIRNTLPELQHTFCALWNEILLEAREQGEDNAYVKFLREIRAPYIELHRGTDAALAFPASTHYFDPVLVQPSSYQYCNIAGHRQDLSVYTPSLIFPSFTPLNQSPARSLALPSPIDGDHIPDRNISSQQAEEANVIVEPPSPTDHTPDLSHTEGFMLPLLATNSVHVAQATSGPGSITWGPDDLVPGEASHDPSPSALSSAEIAATDHVRSDDSTTLTHTGEPGETYQVPVTPSLLFQHHVLVPATMTPYTGPDPGSDPDTLQDTTSSVILSHPLEGSRQQVSVTSREAPDIGENMITVNPIPQSIPTVSLNIVVTEPPSSPILLPALSSGMTVVGPPLYAESSPIQPDHFLHAPSQSSSIATTSSHIPTQVASALDSQVTSRIVTSNPYDDSRGLNPSIPTTLLPHLNQMAVDMVANTLPHEDQVRHDPDGL
jgi:hypothetical protein